MKHGSDWYKRDPQAYLGGVQGFTAREHAVYSVVLDLIYQHGGSINNDPKWVAGWISDMGSAAVRTAINSLVEKGKLKLVGEQITQKRAENEAKTKEKLRETAQKNGKKGGKKSAEMRAEVNKTRETAQATASTETQTEKIREEKNIEIDDDNAGARVLSPHQPDDPTDRERLLQAMGADPISGLIGPNGKQIGRIADMIEAKRWQEELKLSLEEVLGVVSEVMANKHDGPPFSFKYFTAAMQEFAGQKSKPTLTPIEGGARERPGKPDRIQRIVTAAAEGTSGQDWG